MLPPFDECGNLPPGIHWVTWEEFSAQYGTNTHRMRLLAGLRDALKSLQAAGCRAVYIDGSFVTSKELPADFDACWEEEGMDEARLDPVLLLHDPKRQAQKARYGGELIGFRRTNTSILKFYQRDRNMNTKGIVGLRLRGEPL